METISMPAPMERRVSLSPELERRRIISVQQAAEIKNLSEDTFKRHYPHLIKKLSPRRIGCELGEVLDA
jgi:hypothetical protein